MQNFFVAFQIKTLREIRENKKLFIEEKTNTFRQYSKISSLSLVQTALGSGSEIHLLFSSRYWLWYFPCPHKIATIG